MKTQDRVDQVRAAIRAQQEHIYQQYNDIYDEVKGELVTNDPDWLFEYVFNCDDRDSAYNEMVKKNLFKDE